jgi:uncharacterized protein (DUF486 family)
MNNPIQTRWLPIVVLACSNVFMTFAGLLLRKVGGSFSAARLKQ